jgi:endonuclease III related protein
VLHGRQIVTSVVHRDGAKRTEIDISPAVKPAWITTLVVGRHAVRDHGGRGAEAKNTAWANVERAIACRKQAGCLSTADILRCQLARLAELIRSSGYFNSKVRRLREFCLWHQAAVELERLRHRPTARLRAVLLSIHGIGAETADDMLLYIFDRPMFVIDADTRRIVRALRVDSRRQALRRDLGQFERALDRDVLVFKEFRALMVVHDKDVCRAQRVVTSAGMPRIARPRRSNDSVASYSFAVAQGGVFATSSRLTDKV